MHSLPQFCHFFLMKISSVRIHLIILMHSFDILQWICLFVFDFLRCLLNPFRSTRMPSMYAAAEDDGLADDYGRCTDVRCGNRTTTLGGQSTSHFISEGFVQYSQPSFNGMVELYQSSASINMCS